MIKKSLPYGRDFSGSTANDIGGGYSANAVTPTSDGTTPVYLLALDNEEGKDIVINGKDYPDAHGNEKKIYVYLPAATEAEPNIVKADEEIIHKFFYDNVWKERCITGVASKLLGTGDSVANISMNPSNGYAENGEKITVNAQNMLGYTFKGWYLPEDIDESYQIKEGRVAQSTSYIYTFNPSKYIMLYAIYEAAGEAEVICGGGDFKVAVNGEEASDIQNSYTEQLAIGSEVTITVTDDNFINWLNGNNKIVTTEKEYTFTVTGDITLTMGKQGEKGQTAMVEFVSAYNQLIAGQIYDSDDTIAFPSYPSKVGYIFTGWSLTEEEIHTKISEGETHITVVPVYEQNIGKTHDVDVYVDGNWDSDLSVEEVLPGTTMTLKAPAIEGKVFLYWTDGFNIVGYNDSYFLQVNSYYHIYAVYGDEVVEEKPVIAMTDVFTTSNNDKDKLSFSVTRNIPDGYTLIEHGMLYHTKQEITTPTVGSFILGGTGVNKYVSTDSHKLGVFTLNVNVTGANTAMVIARGYMIVRNNATGNEEIYYSDISHTNYDDKNRRQ